MREYWLPSYRQLMAELGLQNDKRYTVFDHAPQEREIWLRVSSIVLEESLATDR